MEIKINKVNNESKEPVYFKQEMEEQRPKLFANKKANIALAIVGGIIALAFIAGFVIQMLPA